MQLSPSASSANQFRVQPRYSGGIGVSGNETPLGLKFLLIPALVASLVLATSHIAFATAYTGDGWHDGYTDGRADCLADVLISYFKGGKYEIPRTPLDHYHA